jgi:hypothetical protein
MPTIQQLPLVTAVTPADEIPLSQSGSTCAVSVGTLLAGVQPSIMAPTGTLLGRNSIGPGGPETVSVGLGLELTGSVLSANGADHSSFPIETTLVASDQLVVNSGGSPKLLPVSLLQGLTGTGGAGTSYSIGSLPQTTTIAATDLVGISQAGTDHTITYGNFLDGQTIDLAQPAVPAADTDTFWVAQGSSTMLRQTFAAIWNWLAPKLATYKLPVVEITTDTTLDGTVHNGRILVCSQPVTLTPVFVNMGSGFSCDVLNLSGGNVTLATGIITSSGLPSLPSGEAASLRGVSYSGGNVVFAAMSGSGTAGAPAVAPGQVTGLQAVDISPEGLVLSWSLPATGGVPASYVIQLRQTGTSSWSTANASLSGTTATVSGLSAATSYDFTITATNGAGPGPASAIFTASTTAAAIAPGQVSGLAVTGSTASSISLAWSAPSAGGAPTSYTIQYLPAGATNWVTAASAITTTSATITGLSAATSYSIEVIAVNASGEGAPSSALAASTAAAGSSVISITWQLAPSGNYTIGGGSIGVNAHVNPADAPVQVGVSNSAATPPTSWVAAIHVNSDFWGAYVPTPATAGTYYAWCSGTDGSAPTVYPTAFTVS